MTRRGGFRPATDWLAALGSGTLSATGECDAFVLTDTPEGAPGFTPETVMGGLIWATAARVAGGTEPGVTCVGFGLGYWPIQQTELSATEVYPCPVTNADWDGWLWTDYVPILGATAPYSFNTGFMPGNVHQTQHRFRSKRRLEDGQLIFVIETFPDEGPAVFYDWHIRWLQQLSAKR